MSLELEFHLQFLCDSQSSDLSDFCQSARCGNGHKCNKHCRTCAKGNDVNTNNVISAKQHFVSTFSMQIFKFQRRRLQALLPFPARPPEHPKELAHRLVIAQTFLPVLRNWNTGLSWHEIKVFNPLA